MENYVFQISTYEFLNLLFYKRWRSWEYTFGKIYVICIIENDVHEIVTTIFVNISIFTPDGSIDQLLSRFSR